VTHYSSKSTSGSGSRSIVKIQLAALPAALCSLGQLLTKITAASSSDTAGYACERQQQQEQQGQEQQQQEQCLQAASSPVVLQPALVQSCVLAFAQPAAAAVP
jgi:hypothetical protein